MKFRVMIIFVFFISIANTALTSANPIYHYQPENVVLEGTLDEQTFAEQPGYESIANGDASATYWFLKLANPIDVFPGDPKDRNAEEPKKSVKIMEMAVMNDSDWTVLKKMKKGTPLKLYGSLFHQLTGHHHSRVLIEVHQVKR